MAYHKKPSYTSWLPSLTFKAIKRQTRRVKMGCGIWRHSQMASDFSCFMRTQRYNLTIHLGESTDATSGKRCVRSGCGRRKQNRTLGQNGVGKTHWGPAYYIPSLRVFSSGAFWSNTTHSQRQVTLFRREPALHATEKDRRSVTIQIRAHVV